MIEVKIKVINLIRGKRKYYIAIRNKKISDCFFVNSVSVLTYSTNTQKRFHTYYQIFREFMNNGIYRIMFESKGRVIKVRHKDINDKYMKLKPIEIEMIKEYMKKKIVTSPEVNPPFNILLK